MGDSSYPSSATAALLAFSPLAHLANELIFSGYAVPSLRESCTTNLSAFLLVLQGLPAVVLCFHVTALVSRRTTASSEARTATPAVASGVPPTGVPPSRPDGGAVERQQAADAVDADANTVKTSGKIDEPELDQESGSGRVSTPVEPPRKRSERDTAQYDEFLQFLASPEMKSLPSTPAGKLGAASSRASRSDFKEETDASSETSSTPLDEFLRFIASPEMKSLPSSSKLNRCDSGEETDVTSETSSSETSSTMPAPQVASKHRPPTKTTSSMNNVRKNLFREGQVQ